MLPSAMNLRFLSSTDAPDFNALNRAAFHSGLDFWANPVYLVWSSTESENPALGIFKEDRLIAYMRVELYAKASDLERRLVGFKTSLFDFPLNFPLLHISRSATHPDFERQGLNSLLRALFLELGRQAQIEQSISTMLATAPRIQTMQKMGYRFTPNPVRWNGILKSEKPALFAVVSLASPQNLSAECETFLQNAGGAFKTWVQRKTWSVVSRPLR